MVRMADNVYYVKLRQSEDPGHVYSPGRHRLSDPLPESAIPAMAAARALDVSAVVEADMSWLDTRA